MNTKNLMVGVLALFVSSVITPANAVPITWNLTNVFLGDGSAVTGYFTFDATTGSYLDWSIHTARSDNYYGGYTASTSYLLNGTSSNEFNAQVHVPLWNGGGLGCCILTLFFDPLTNAGGTTNVGGYESSDVNGNLFTNYGGSLVAVSSVPEPAAAWLFGSGLLGLVCMVRRKKA